jgi:hypothetical protein
MYLVDIIKMITVLHSSLQAMPADNLEELPEAAEVEPLLLESPLPMNTSGCDSYFKRSASLLGFKSSEAADPCFSARHFTSRFTSNGSFVDSDSEFRCSQESKVSISELEDMVAANEIDESNSLLTPGVITPLRDDFTDHDQILLLTPPKTCKTPSKPPTELDPPTPMANLKVLMSAMSPELRDREQMKEVFGSHGNLHLQRQAVKRSKQPGHKAVPPPKRICSDDIEDDLSSEMGDQPGGRKERSLALLCERFV